MLRPLRSRAAGAALVAAAAVLAPGAALGLDAGGADAPAARIAFVEPGAAEVRILLSVPADAQVDPASVQVTLDGEALPSTATTTDDGPSIRRTTVLAIDTSRSMRGARFREAKSAAAAFLRTAPDDVRVGIVSFAADVTVAQPPTLDREAALAVLDDLTLSLQTRLHDGIVESVSAAGDEGQRSVLVLSDGRDTSETPLDEVLTAVEESGVTVDVVALEQGPAALAALTRLTEPGDGQVLDAATPEALTAFFAAASEALAAQLEVTATLPDEGATEGTLEVTALGADGPLSAAVFARVRTTATEEAAGADAAPALQAAPSGLAIPLPVVIGALVALAVALAFLLFQGLTRSSRSARPASVEDQIGAYGAQGTAATGGPAPAFEGGAGGLRTADSVITQAKDATAQALSGHKTLEARIAARLEGASSSLKPAEWVLLQAMIAVVAAALGLLLSSGNPALMVLFGVVGAVVPWVYLGRKGSKRRKAFDAGLADTLQLIAGSLQAGLSLMQSVDTIVREGHEPISGEFRRVLAETRLGVNLEEALDEVATRMKSVDFAWVVMAVRIQREVGGNLAELLLTVAATLREREYLRRHVSALSAEGRLSGWVLGSLPPVFLGFLLLFRREYVMPIFIDPRGWVILAAAALLLTVGAFWMAKTAKVDI
ncbi:MAG: type II secretion system F family protein [Nocardioides sp.]|nr:type II secretion system F family protein [Nocardioides sp.]